MATNANKIIARYGDGSREENRCSGERNDYNMENLAKINNLTVLDNVGVDFVLTPEMYNPTSDKREEWDDILDFITTHKSCTGFANHAVMVSKKGM